MKDPIVEEVRAFRDEHTKRFKYNLDAIFADIRVLSATVHAPECWPLIDC